MAVNFGLIAYLAARIGAPEAAFRLLLTIASGYPIGILYRKYIQDSPKKSLHHIYFVTWGILLCAFNYGIDTYHSMIAIWTTYILIRLLHQAPKALVAINFIFNMSYLLVGYYFTESNEYDILWTMPHCVLTLRMIGFGFDFADGQRPKDQLSKEQKETHLSDIPSLLELFAFAYFPSSFIIGPQFPFRRYKRFIDGEFRQYTGNVQAGIKRMLVGFVYLGIRQIGATWLPDEYFLSDDFKNLNFILRLYCFGLWGKLSLYKYISCWLLTEGALMCIGFSYNGKNAEGEDDWYGCSNVQLILFETGNSMSHYVQSFNVNTNQWVSQYVYKRLRFLNNRTISYAAALGFLAVWHGFHSGYYMSFLIEYMIVTVEKQMETTYTKDIVPSYGDVLKKSLPLKALTFFALKSYNIIYTGWCLAPFLLLSYDRWIHVFSAVRFYGFVYVAIWLALHKMYKYHKRNAHRTQNAQIFSNATTLSPQVQSNSKND